MSNLDVLRGMGVRREFGVGVPIVAGFVLFLLACEAGSPTRRIDRQPDALPRRDALTTTGAAAATPAAVPTKPTHPDSPALQQADPLADELLEDDGAYEPCTHKNFATEQVREACQKGGRAAVKVLMKHTVDKAARAGTKLKCLGCHKDRKTFELEPDAPETLKKWL